MKRKGWLMLGPSYDLFIYHDMTDFEDADIPAIGEDAKERFGNQFDGLYVTAVGPGIHPGRTTVVLSHERRPDYQREIKDYFSRG
jgi:hypothetical protein